VSGLDEPVPAEPRIPPLSASGRPVHDVAAAAAVAAEPASAISLEDPPAGAPPAEPTAAAPPAAAPPIQPAATAPAAEPLTAEPTTAPTVQPATAPAAEPLTAEPLGAAAPTAEPTAAEPVGESHAATASPNGLGAAPADDLREIRGIGPATESALHDLGIHTYRQLAVLDAEGRERLRVALRDAQRRIERQDWVRQAAELHRAKYGGDPLRPV
jgi:predicted flap endonuclease-1-like 5' DNA nuclease